MTTPLQVAEVVAVTGDRSGIDQHRRRLLQKLTHDVDDIWRQFRFVQSVIHQGNPAIASLLRESERGVSHSKPRVSALVEVAI